jgi:hypothetical protein
VSIAREQEGAPSLSEDERDARGEPHALILSMECVRFAHEKQVFTAKSDVYNHIDVDKRWWGLRARLQKRVKQSRTESLFTNGGEGVTYAA